MTSEQITWMISLCSLSVALLGGVPGILAMVERYRRRDRMFFKLHSFIRGEMTYPDSSPTREMMLLSGHVANKGASPLYPMRYAAEATVSGVRWKLEPHLIGPNMNFASTVQNIQFQDAPGRDLQRLNSLLKEGAPEFGHLLFLFPESFPKDPLKRAPVGVTLICTDSLDREHRFSVTIQPQSLPSYTGFPKIGLEVSPRSEQGVPK